MEVYNVMGTLYIIIVYNVTFFIILMVLRILERIIYYISGYENQWFKTKYNNIIGSIFWNGPLRFIMESYLEVMITVLIAMHKKTRFTTYEETLSNVVMILCLCSYVCAPFIVLFVITWERKKISRELYWIEHFKKSNAYKNKWAQIFPIYSLYGEALF